MSKNKRKSRKNKGKDKIDFLKPIDLKTVGSKDDPCFGKLYNLSTKECKRCGDSELCGVVFGQNLHKVRGKIEKNNDFKDLNLGNNEKAIKAWVIQKKAEGLTRAETIKKAKKIFNCDRKTVKTHW